MSKDRAPILLKRRGDFLVAASAPTQRFIQSLPLDVVHRARDITRPRSRPANALYWTLLTLVADNLPGDVRDWHLHELLKLRFGVSVEFNLRTMGKVTISGSTAFDAMPEEEWREFLPKVIDFLCEEVIPGMGKEDLMAMAREMVGEKSP